MKALRSLEQHVDSLLSYDYSQISSGELIEKLKVVDDRRIYKIAEAFRRGVDQEVLHEITKIDNWFLSKIGKLVRMEERIAREPLTKEVLMEAKRMEFPDSVIAKLTKLTEEKVRQMRYAYGIRPAYQIVDTCAAEFDAETPYYYSVYGSENEAEISTGRKKVLILGSGPIRIGQGIDLISVAFILHGHLKRKDMRRSLSTIIRRR